MNVNAARHMPLRILQVPYDSGQRALRMGRGPLALIERGLAEQLRAMGHDVDVESIESVEPFPSEIRTTFELNRLLAERVAHATREGRLPIVLSGNCNAAIGAVTGIDPLRTALIWFDAHGEFNTPETTIGGFLDGMGLAMATGRCWREMTARIPGFHPFPDTNIALVGVRDLDAQEERELMRSAITVLPPSLIRDYGIAGASVPMLAALRDRTRDVYIHLDLDSLDPGEASANQWAVREGLKIAEVEGILALVRERFTLRGFGIGSYDPDVDRDGRGFDAIVGFMDVLLARVERALSA